MYIDTIHVLKNFEETNFKVFGSSQERSETERIFLLNVLGEAYIGQGDCKKGTAILSLVLELRPLLSSTLTQVAKCDLKEKHVKI